MDFDSLDTQDTLDCRSWYHSSQTVLEEGSMGPYIPSAQQCWAGGES